MINDPKSAQFIAWTELGTSFVVSNVGEFSRSILGSHFKHNNFSSFVRQLNMYGFHKINRTPRAQRTSTDAQTWEFSHHKFLRGRPDLLDEIKRKALEPDPGMKHRVELPGEVAAQLGAMRDENRRMWDQLTAERRKVEKLVNVVGRLWDVVGKGFPGSVPQFPQDLLETADSPNIYVTSPTATSSSRFPPPLSMNMHSIHSLNSPNSSPTTADFPSSHSHHSHALNHHAHQQQQQQQHHHPHHHQHPGHLSRQHSFHHVGYPRADNSSASTPLPSSPGSITMDMFDDGSCEPPPSGRGSTKRQRLDDSGAALGISVNGLNGVGASGGVGDSMSLMSSVSSPGTGTGPAGGISSLTVPGKKSSRARSDSAPLGYGSGLGSLHSWQQGASGLGNGGRGVGVG
ncbi:HSF-type DNA-binding-domain-containing protein [Crassisporium funariophilum]|nr:HSF-type DNA-binding-domain-containing protein [Crassisporium funariophilum]